MIRTGARVWQRMIELVKPGGWLIITCAAPGRGEHELGLFS